MSKRNLSVLCVIPARGGSKGIPKKNLKPLAGIPLIAHSILCAKMIKVLKRIIVSTDDEKIAKVALNYGALVPFIRPPELARDDTPMMPVLKHALKECEKIYGERYDLLLLLDPTSPGRYPQDITKAIKILKDNPECDSVIGVSEPDFNPYWHCVILKNGFMKPLIKGASKYTRRQDVPEVYRINASLYLFRRKFLLSNKSLKWIEKGKNMIIEIPEKRAIHIDDMEDLEKVRILVESGYIRLPWIQKA